MKIFCAFFACIFLLSKEITGECEIKRQPQRQPLCDMDGIRLEISKAIEILKIKSTNTTPELSRQDEDYDGTGEIPYYVPAIAKVVASVLAQNATNVIEESFGFIPPEINKNIRYVLGLVAETVNKLRPTPAPTVAPKPLITQPPATAINPVYVQVPAIPINSVVNAPAAVPVTPVISNEQASNIESLLAYALAQQLISKDSTERILKAPETEATSTSKIKVENTPELFTTTFKYSKGQSITSNTRLSTVEDEQSVYAPAYAPNYGVTTTKSPIYASAFYHNVYTTPAVPQITSSVPISGAQLNASTTKAEAAVTIITETTDSEATTEDYYDEYVTEDVTSSTVISKVSSGSVTAAAATVITTSPPEDGDEYDTKDRSVAA